MSKKLLVAALLPTAAFAQPSLPANDTMVVTANRVEQPVSAVLAPVVVIDRAEIESRQVQSLPALLKTLPGVQITRSTPLRSACFSCTKALPSPPP